MTTQTPTTFFSSPLTIGDLEVDSRVFLAPLAGVSDIPFRRVCRAAGAGLVYVEMLSADAVNHGGKRTFQMMERHPDEDILGVQITGRTAETVASAVAILDEQPFDTIDINMGCPVKKIVAKGWGSAFLLDLPRITETVGQCRDRTEKPLSVKVRLGYTHDDINVEEVVTRAVRAGADMVTVHGRVRDDSYEAQCDFAAIGRAVKAVHAHQPAGLVTVGNGDVLNAPSARDIVQQSGCDAVMVARGALGNPWIFSEILEGAYPAVPPEEWLDVVKQHMSGHNAFYGGGVKAAARFRKQLLWYVQGFPGSRDMRRTLATTEDLEETARVLTRFVAELPEGTTRDPNFDYRKGKR